MTSPILFVMGILDVLGGALAMNIPQSANVGIMVYSVPWNIAFYFGFALLVKGALSLVFSFIRSD